MFHPVRGSWRWPMIYRKSYRITQKLIWWRVSKSFRGTLSSHDVRENFGKATRPVSSILERTRSRVMRMAASKISWFNFPSVATRDNFVRDSPTGNGRWPNVKCTKLRAIPFSLSLFVPTYGEKCFTIKLWDRRLSNISWTRPLKAPTIELGKTSWLNHRRVYLFPPHHFCLCNWFIAIVVWKLGRAKCSPTFAVKPWRTKLL